MSAKNTGFEGTRSWFYIDFEGYGLQAQVTDIRVPDLPPVSPVTFQKFLHLPEPSSFRGNMWSDLIYDVFVRIRPDDTHSKQSASLCSYCENRPT